MKLNMKLFSAITAFGIMTLATMAIGVNNNVVFSNAEVETYTIILSNAKNKVTQSSNIQSEVAYTTSLGNEIDFSLSGIDVLNNGWGIIDQGYIDLNDPLRNIQSVVIKTQNSEYAPDLIRGAYSIRYDYNPVGSSTTDNIYTYNFSVPTNYISIEHYAPTPLEVVSIEIVYSCSTIVMNPLLYSDYLGNSGIAGTTEDLLTYLVAQDYLFNDIQDRISYTIISGSGTMNGSIFTYGPSGDETVIQANLTDSDGRTTDPVNLTFTAE